MLNIRDIKKWGRKRVPSLWSFGNYAYWRLRLAMPWTETTMFQQIRRIRESNRLDRASCNESRKKVLFFATRQERDQVAMTSMLSWALDRRGHIPIVLGCDRALRTSCNSGMWPKLDPWLCRSCHHYAEHALSLAGMKTEWLSQSLPSGSRERARAAVNRLCPEDYQGFLYRGYPVGRIVRPSVAHFLRTDKILNDHDAMRVYRDWIESGICLVDLCENLLDRHKPDVIVMLNGLFAPEWIMLEAAKRRGVRSVCWEVGFVPETFHFRPNHATDLVDNDLWKDFRDIPLTPEESRRLDRYLALRETGGGYLVNYFPDLKDSADEICREFGIDRSKVTFVLFPNITWDSSCFEKDLAFNGLADWLTETILFFADRPDAQLIVRVHPAEKVLKGAGRDSVATLIRERFPRRPANLIVVPPESGASSYVLMNLATCGLVYGSTTGIEMGVRGIPVVVAADVYYRGFGLTFDPATREDYRKLLDEFLSGRIATHDPRRIEAWRRYAYFAIFRSSIPLPKLCYSNEGDLPTWRFQQMTELDPGKDLNLDVVCQGITEGTPFLTAHFQWGD